MNNENYTVGWFINFFEAIPEDKWCISLIHDGNGRHCALGHCGGIITNKVEMALRRLLFPTGPTCVGGINDGNDPRYQQPTPKLRILAALHDIKRQQEEAAEAFELRPLNLSKPQLRCDLDSLTPLPTVHDPLGPLMKQI